jgi:Uncharacterized protein conserved in bacteria
VSIIKEILAWGKALPPWQSDAVRRLFAKETLAPEDLDDLYALLKLEHGIPDQKGRIPKHLSDDDVPTGAKPSEQVDLLAIKDLVNVNAIAKNQRLQFGQKGLTVIYGDNGSGKSGYSRVLKKACRARDRSEPILPNANTPRDKIELAAAVFEIAVNGVAEEVKWEDGRVPPQALSAVAIFDSACARAYLDREDDFSYVPYGLDVLESLAAVCKEFDGRIKSELAQCSVDKSIFGDVTATQTAVGRLLANLSAKTNKGDVEKLAAMSAAEVARRDDVEKSLRTDNPKEKAGQLRLMAARIAKLASNVDEKAALVSDQALNTLKGLAEAYHISKAAAELAANEFKADKGILPGTGGEAWKELFEAARRFSVEAYRDQTFPQLGEDAPCPLCQQPLGFGATRLARFEAFVQQEAEKNMRASKKALVEQYRPFEAANLSIGFDDVFFKEIEGLDTKLANSIRTYETSLIERHKAIVQAFADRGWGGVGAESASVAPQLRILEVKLLKEAEDLEKAADEKARALLQAEFDELEARMRLSRIKGAVLSALEKYSLAAKLTKCASAVKTNAITIKSTELAEKVVSKELADALNSEFKALGAGNLHVSLATRSAKGKTLHKLKIEMAQARNPSEILSEGEQRAIAIGSFLAEVNIGGGSGGIMFDDPVSSLDHRRRERVAIRLVNEAKKRQVIVLTHDVYFLCVLMEEGDRLGIPVMAQSLYRRSEGVGVADPRLPFEALNTKGRIGALRNAQQQIAKLYKDGDEAEFRRQTVDCYRQLRIAWERAVEEVLFQNVVLRFRKGISTQPLVRVEVSDDDYQTIEQAMTKCSNYPHDQGALGGLAIPEPDELLADINALDDWRISVGRRADDVAKRRKA